MDKLGHFSSLAETYKKHFTASAIIIEQNHILLVHHKRIGAWLPPGGHIEENELPHQTVIREAEEETGLPVSIISCDLPKTETADAFFLPNPLCIHAVKAIEAKGAFYHIDLAYLCQLKNLSSTNKNGFLPELVPNEETYGVAWVKLSKLHDLPLANNVIELVSVAKSKLKLLD